MKAAVYRQYGPPSVVSVQEIEKPEPKSNEIRVKVFASTVNRTDCGFRSAQYFISRLFSGIFRPKNKVLGCEFAGEVDAVGSAVTAYKPGDKIVGYDDTHFGGHANYKIIACTKAFTTLPANMDYYTAAALTEGSHYALCNIKAAKVKAGHKVLVYGATGAIGSAAIQLLKYFGAYVVAVCHSPDITLVKSLGADEVIDLSFTDYASSHHRFQFVFDAVGKTSFKRSKPVMEKEGIYISTELGKHAQNILLALLTSFRKRKKVLFPIPSISKNDVYFLKTLAEQEYFKPLIDSYYSLNEIREAYQYVETGQKKGNVIIKIQ